MPPGWMKSGYKKKERCEKCSFRFKFSDQATVYHVDGNVENNDWSNLKTVCANCGIEVRHGNLAWVTSEITPDL